MKKIFYLFVLFLLHTLDSAASVGIFAQGVNISGTNYTSSTTISGSVAAGSLILASAGASSWQNGGDDICSANMAYSVSGGGVSGIAPLGYVSAGPSAGDKVFANPLINVNISTLAPGTYTLICNFSLNGQFGGVTCFGSGNPFTTSTLTTVAITFTIAAPLPLTLTKFQGAGTNNQNLLSWETATERNTSYFEIEKSTNQQGWVNIGQIASAKNADSRQSYRFIDQKTEQITSYYRLKMVDADATFSYSPLIVIARESNTIRLFPNPVHDVLVLENVEEGSVLEAVIINVNGQVVYRNTLNDNRLSLENLSDGIYFLQLRNEAGEIVIREKLIKN